MGLCAGAPWIDTPTPIKLGDWLGNQVPYILASVTSLLPHAKSGKLKAPQVRARIESQAGRIATGGPVERAALVAVDIKTLSKPVKDRNIRPE